MNEEHHSWKELSSPTLAAPCGSRIPSGIVSKGSPYRWVAPQSSDLDTGQVLVSGGDWREGRRVDLVTAGAHST